MTTTSIQFGSHLLHPQRFRLLQGQLTSMWSSRRHGAKPTHQRSKHCRGFRVQCVESVSHRHKASRSRLGFAKLLYSDNYKHTNWQSIDYRARSDYSCSIKQGQLKSMWSSRKEPRSSTHQRSGILSVLREHCLESVSHQQKAFCWRVEHI